MDKLCLVKNNYVQRHRRPILSHLVLKIPRFLCLNGSTRTSKLGIIYMMASPAESTITVIFTICKRLVSLTGMPSFWSIVYFDNICTFHCHFYKSIQRMQFCLVHVQKITSFYMLCPTPWSI